MSGACIVFIESNTTGTGRLFAREARQQGFRPVVVCATPERYAYIENERIDVLRADTSAPGHILEMLRRFSTQEQIAGVLSSSDYFVQTAAEVAQELGLPGPSPAALRTVKDKLEQRKHLEAAGVPIPRFRAASTADEAANAAQAIGYPVVIKPCFGSGSYGVRLCASRTEVEEHTLTLLALRQNERGQPLPPRVLVEEFAVGPEYSVETFSLSVAGVTAKYLGIPPRFVEVGHDFPADLEESTRSAVCGTALDSLRAMGLGWGPAHIEVKLTQTGPCVIEVNSRLAGGFIPELVRLASGVDLIALTIQLAAGLQLRLHQTEKRYASIRFLLAPADGSFAGISGYQAAQTSLNVQVDVYRKQGDPIQRYGDFRDRVGHVLAVADTASSAQAMAGNVQRQIAVLVDARKTQSTGQLSAVGLS